MRTVHRFGYAFCASVIEPAIARPTPLVADPMCWVVAGTRRVPLVRRRPRAWPRSGRRGLGQHIRCVAPSRAASRVNGADAAIEDLGSKNGTFVRGERISGLVLLNDGDEIRLGLLRSR